MGMFDHVDVSGVKDKLGHKFSKKDLKDFQTKDFENQMHIYIITKEGRLMYQDFDYESVPEEERPFYGKKEWKNPLGKMCGCIKGIPKPLKDMDFHGVFNFYTGIRDVNSKKKGAWKWYEYNAKFTDGNLVSIEEVKSE